MLKAFLVFLNFCILKVIPYYIPEENHNITSITSFAFGSCYNLHKSVSRYEMFNIINSNSPDVFMWLGDAAYVTYYPPSKYKLVRLFHHYFNVFGEFNITRPLIQFNNTKNSPDYVNFSKHFPVIGVWDDNDYGINDGNLYFPYKEEMKTIFLDFLDEPKNSHRREPGKAIYTTYVFGDNTYKNIRVILLDVRFKKTSLIEKNRDMLGEEQWKWLEDVLMKANETFILISSGTQFLPIDRIYSECWFPESRIRLFELFKKVKKNGIILLTGDIHNGQILRTPCTLEHLGYPLYEITSSGMGHHCKPNCDLVIDHILPNMYKYSETINYYNYAQLYFDWGEKKEDSKITVKLIDIDNRVRISLDITYKELTRDDTIKGEECFNRIKGRFKPLKEYIKYYLDRKENGVYFYGILALLIAGASVMLNLVFIINILRKKCKTKKKTKVD